MPPPSARPRPGLRYVRHTPIVVAVFAADINAMLFGSSTALFPALNAAHFDGSPQTLGLLTAAPGVGGVLSALLSGITSRAARQGMAMLVGTAIWGIAMVGFGLTTWLWLALPLLAVAGAADTLLVTFRTAIVQTVTPDELLGRVSSVDYIIGNGGGGLGRVESGTVASVASPAFSVISGGVACALVSVFIGMAFPALLRYRPPTAEPVREPVREPVKTG